MDHILRNGATLGVLTSNIVEQQNIKYLHKRKDNHISKIQIKIQNKYYCTNGKIE